MWGSSICQVSDRLCGVEVYQDILIKRDNGKMELIDHDPAIRMDYELYLGHRR